MESSIRKYLLRSSKYLLVTEKEGFKQASSKRTWQPVTVHRDAEERHPLLGLERPSSRHGVHCTRMDHAHRSARPHCRQLVPSAQGSQPDVRDLLLLQQVEVLMRIQARTVKLDAHVRVLLPYVDDRLYGSTTPYSLCVHHDWLTPRRPLTMAVAPRVNLKNQE